MTTKITALTMSVCAAVLYLFSWTSPNDPLFFFVSNNSFIAIARLLVAGGLIWLSYKKRFHFKGVKLLLGLTAIALIAFGAITISIPTLYNSLYGLVNPLDYLFFITGGFFLAASVLGIKPGKKPLPRPALSKMPEFGPLVRLRQTKWSL